jgi:glycosyltransferase involved in cell wall biosynthesis
MNIAVSVVLCTYNREARLDAAIESLLSQEPGTPAYEVIVVDNASTDGTPERLARWAERANGRLRIIREERLGLSYARNAGIAAARASIVAFTDDDVRVATRWVGIIADRAAAQPDIGWIGGRVRPTWPSTPPPWLTRDTWAPLGLQDHGELPFIVGAGRPVCLIGANLAVRTRVLREAGGFSTDVQRVGDGIGSTEDHDLQDRLWRSGLVGLYEPALVVHAAVDPERLTKTYQRRWHLGHGRFIAKMELPEMEAYGGRRWFAVPLHILRSTNVWFALGFVRERLLRPLEQQHCTRGLVSIVIPCFNQGEFLGEALASALGQQNCEVIVIDDGSTDDSARVAARFVRARLLRQPNRGLSAARNAGAMAARGEFVLFLDSDDRLRPGAVAMLRRALEATASAPFAYGRFAMIDASGRQLSTPRPVMQAVDEYQALLRSNFICAPGVVLYRREAVLGAGGFRSSDAAADYDLYLRLARVSRPVLVDATIGDYRTHPASMSQRAALMLRDTLRVHRRAKRHLVTDEERRAWRAGRAYWREFYGCQVMDAIRRAWHARRFLTMAHNVLQLARYAPAVLRANLARKLAVLARPLQRTRYTAKRPSS